MNVFVANGTHQPREFHYRLPDRPTGRILMIEAGRQKQFPEDLEGAALASLLKQLHMIGAVPEDELSLIKVPNALVYRVSKPITSDKIDEAQALDIEARQELSGQKLEESGLAAFGTAQAALRSLGMGGAAEALSETSVEVTETTDVKTVPDGVNYEAKVSKRAPARGGVKRSTKR